MIQENLDKIAGVFARLGIPYVEPYDTTVGEVVNKEKGNHRGIYWIFPLINFYIGLSASLGSTMSGVRFDTHILKFLVDLATLYGRSRSHKFEEKCEPYKKLPAGWNYALRKHIINEDYIPSHWIKVPVDQIPPGKGGESGKKWVRPGVLDYPVTYREGIDPYEIPVKIWNLNHLTPKQIADLEKAIIKAIWPEANDETYNKFYKHLDK